MAILIDNRRVIGRGAVATVHPVISEGDRGKVAKIYHDPAKLSRSKIEAMLARPPRPLTTRVGAEEFPKYAWPVSIVEHQDVAVGFVMPAVDPALSLTLDHFYDRALLAERGLPDGLPLTFKLDLCRNLSLVLSDLHAHGHFVVDFKPQNMKVYKRTHIVAMLDCDSYCIRGDGGRVFSATNYSSGYIAPEALRARAAPKSLGEHQDRFALAVVLFQLLNNGIHPFQGILQGDEELSTNDEKVREGLYPHGLTPNPGIRPIRLSMHRCFDDRTRALFDRAFAGAPAERPSPGEWTRHFSAILQNKGLEKCSVRPDDANHIRFAGQACAACALAAAARRPAKPKRARVATAVPPGVPAPAPRQDFARLDKFFGALDYLFFDLPWGLWLLTWLVWVCVITGTYVGLGFDKRPKDDWVSAVLFIALFWLPKIACEAWASFRKP